MRYVLRKQAFLLLLRGKNCMLTAEPQRTGSLRRERCTQKMQFPPAKTYLRFCITISYTRFIHPWQTSGPGSLWFFVPLSFIPHGRNDAYSVSQSIVMKSLYLFTALVVLALSGSAQTKPAAPKTVTTATPSSFEASLVQGTLTLNKALKQGEGRDFIAVYTLLKNDAGFNGRKPIQVSLSRQSFDSVFTKTTADLAARWPLLNKHIEDNKLSLTTENDWINLISLFNSLR